MEEKTRSDAIVAELRRSRERGQEAAVEEKRSKFVIFSLHDGLYALGGADVREILPALEIFPVPGAPRSVPGVINNRGDIEAVVELQGFLGLPESHDTAASRIVLTEKAGVRAGIRVDAVVDVVDLPPSSIKPPQATLESATGGLAVGETILQGRNVVLLDAGRILEALRTHGQ